MEETCVLEKRQKGVQKPGSVMVWGCIGALDEAHLHFCYGSFKAETFVWTPPIHIQAGCVQRDEILVYCYTPKDRLSNK